MKMAEYYKITDRLVPVTWEECQKAPEETYLARLTRKETEKSRFLHSIGYGAVFGTSKIHLCKVEAYMRFLYGTYLTPDRRRMEDAFCFVFDDRHLYLVEEGELAGNLLCRLKKIFEQENAGTGSVLTAFLGQLLQKDLLRLEKIEEGLTHLEDDVLSGRIAGFEQKIIGCRKEILKYAHYYLQLQDMADILMKNDYGAFSEEDLRALRLLREKTGRLHQEAIMLREYSTQVREVYQAQIEIRQNKIMKTLTIVTTICLPLTLIAGWYGMNFRRMPELSWKYGYPAVILLSLCIVALSLYLCRKKKLFF
jgi:magnesium transporter